MKIALVSPIASGATAQTLECLADALQHTVDLTVVAPGHFRPETAATWKYVPVPTPAGRVARGLYWFSPASVGGLKTILGANRFDAIHFLNGPGYLPTLLSPWIFSRTPIIITVHDPVAHSGARIDTICNFAARHLLLPRADAIHTMSAYSKDVLIAQGFAADRIRTTRHGALTSVFSRHNDPSIVRGKSLLFFGRWEHYKGIDLLVEAMILLASRGVREHCILAGPGTVPEQTLARIAQHPDLFEVHNRYLTDAEVASLLQRANRMVLPYRDATQSSLPAIAQAYDHLLIATSVGAFPEEVEAQGGILVQPNSAADLADGIERSNDMVRVPKHAIDYSWESVSVELTQIYRDAIRHRNNVSG